MKIFKFFLLIFCLGVSCGEPEIEIPKEMLSDETMVAILTDFHIIEGAYHKRLINKPGKKDYTAGLFGASLRENGTTKEAFDKSYNFYLSNPTLMEPIMEKVMEELSKEQSRVNTILPDSVQSLLEKEKLSGQQQTEGR